MNPFRMRIFLPAMAACFLLSLAALLLGGDSEKAAVSGVTASQPSPAASGMPEAVSILDLLARPDAYDGKFIRIDGFLHVKFEDCAVFMTKEHADYLMGKYGLWVSFKTGEFIKQKDYDCKYVLLEGVFNKSGHGHMQLFGGELREVSRVLELTHWYDGSKELTKPSK